jgi:hypothetical protein
MSRRRPASPARPIVNNADLQLTQAERTLIANFRAIDSGSKDFLINMSAEFIRTFPIERPRLVLVSNRTEGKNAVAP